MTLKNGYKVNNGNDEKVDAHVRVEKIYNKSSKEEEIEVEDEYEAIDGGWGWMVAVGLIVVFVTTLGPNASFTILFGDFLEATGQVGSVTTMLNSIFNISFSIACLITNPLLKQFPMKIVGIVGAVLFALPNVLCAFVRHVAEMAVLFFLEGIGLGLIFTICNTNFNAYFSKKRSMVMGISQAIVGLGNIIYPIVIELLMEEYGFRGTALLTGAMSLHAIPAMALMIPPSDWEMKFRHQKTLKTDDDKLLVSNDKLMSNGPLHQIPPREINYLKKNDKWNSLRSLQEEDKNMQPLLVPEARVLSVSDVEKGVGRERSKSLLVSSLREWPKAKKDLLMAGFTSSSLTNLRIPPGTESLSNAVRLRQHVAAAKAMVVEENENNEDNETRQSSEKSLKLNRIRNSQILGDLIDFKLLKDRVFLNMCLGISFVFTSDFTFASFLPLMMLEHGYSKADAALTITVSAGAELASRILLAIFTIFIDVRPKIIFFVAMVLMTLAKIGFLYLENTMTGVLIMMATIGSVRSWMFVPQPLVVVENISVDQYAAAYGVYAIISGVISVLFGPFAGLVKDWSDSFYICQLSLIFMNALFIVPWSIELLCGYQKSKK